MRHGDIFGKNFNVRHFKSIKISNLIKNCLITCATYFKIPLRNFYLCNKEHTFHKSLSKNLQTKIKPSNTHIVSKFFHKYASIAPLKGWIDKRISVYTVVTIALRIFS
jgi:hypothetical protein